MWNLKFSCLIFLCLKLNLFVIWRHHIATLHRDCSYFSSLWGCSLRQLNFKFFTPLTRLWLWLFGTFRCVWENFWAYIKYLIWWKFVSFNALFLKLQRVANIYYWLNLGIFFKLSLNSLFSVNLSSNGIFNFDPKINTAILESRNENSLRNNNRWTWKKVRRRGRMKITFCRNWKIELGNFELRRSKSV